MKFQWGWKILLEIKDEIDRGNAKHSHGELANDIQVVAILAEELGEYAQAVMKKQKEQARKELLQVVAVAINHLSGTGPHFSDL